VDAATGVERSEERGSAVTPRGRGGRRWQNQR
jgi:hypothetical protein